MSYGFKNSSGQYIKIAGKGGGEDTTWVGTQEELETALPTIPEGTKIIVTDDYDEPNESYTKDEVDTLLDEKADIDNFEIYSTTETRIGTWIDGKPLYQKVVRVSNPNEGVVIENEPTHNYVCCMGMSTLISTGVQQYPVPTALSGGYTAFMKDAQGKLIIKSTDSWSGYVAEIIIKYTKTTD